MVNPVTFISLGPGDAELITLRGWKALLSAHIIYCPSTVLANGRVTSRAFDILSELKIDLSKVSLFNVPMSKARGEAHQAYRTVAEKIVTRYGEERRIAVVAEGDTGFYSSVHYIMEELTNHSIPVEQLAGVPAFIACSARAGLHLASQEEVLEVLPGTFSASMLNEASAANKVFVVMKVSQCEEEIKKFLSENADFRFHYFENVGIAGKEFYTSDQDIILNRSFPYFSIIIIQRDKTNIPANPIRE